MRSALWPCRRGQQRLDLGLGLKAENLSWCPTQTIPPSLGATGLTPSHRSGVFESLSARFAWQEDDHYGHGKKEVT